MARKKLFGRIGAANKAATIVTNKDRKADFAMGQSSLDSIFANLSTTQKGLGRKLSGANAQTLANMSRLANRSSRGVARDISGGAVRAKTLFGAGIGKVVDQQLISGKGTVAAQKSMSAGNLKAGSLLNRAGNDAMDITQAAAGEAQSGADFMLAQALRVRAKDDAAAQAERTTALEGMKLEHQLSLQRMAAETAQQKEMMRFEQRMEEKSNEQGGGEDYQRAAGVLQELAMSGAKKSQASVMVNSLAAQYNLGPGAISRLTELVGATWTGEGDPQAGTYMAGTDEYGQPYQTDLDDDDKAGLKTTVVQAVKGGKSKAALMEMVKANFVDEEGKPTVHPALIASALEYVELLYDTVAPTAKAVTAAMK